MCPAGPGWPFPDHSLTPVRRTTVIHTRWHRPVPVDHLTCPPPPPHVSISAILRLSSGRVLRRSKILGRTNNISVPWSCVSLPRPTASRHWKLFECVLQGLKHFFDKLDTQSSDIKHTQRILSVNPWSAEMFFYINQETEGFFNLKSS